MHRYAPGILKVLRIGRGRTRKGEKKEQYLLEKVRNRLIKIN